ncbi:MAG: hypothetical protein K8R06_02685 [Methanosarcinales archaeon]|nr:hypothetical protein [Methanosarcinales archaeon]MCD4798450.1 hypothetical protein [Methanosarcinales archaeon]MCD4815291.1 hypothetical protein [Methanosarcinales archaeon]
MCYKNIFFIGIVIISILVISGCTDKTENITEEITPIPTLTPIPTQTKIVADDNSKSVTVNEHLQAIEQYMNNNENAIDVSYEELVSFVRIDQTDKILISPNFTGVDCAITLHNNAEEAGIKSAIVYYEDEFYYDYFNAFNTTDKGLIYISSEGDSDPEFPCNDDWEYKHLEVGKLMSMYHLYKDPCWDEWDTSMKTGILQLIDMIW